MSRSQPGTPLTSLPSAPHSPASRTRIGAATRSVIAFVAALWRHFDHAQCHRRAAALTYYSLFAVVPLLTLVYVSLAGVPALADVNQRIESLLFDHLVPSGGIEVQSYLQQFSHQARNLTGIGILFLLVTALALMQEIEAAFNSIWQVHRRRNGLVSFLAYWSVLSLGPLLIGIGFAISTYVASLQLQLGAPLRGAGHLLLKTLPFLLTSTAVTLAFTAIPNCRVALRHSLPAAIVAALAFEVCKKVFAGVVANSNYQLIYGAFAALPLLLIWIFLCWVIVLGGAALSRTLATFSSERSSALPELLLALVVLKLLWQRHHHGGALRERELLRHHWPPQRQRIAPERWAVLRDKLLAAGLLRVGERGEYLLGRDLHHFSLGQLTDLLHPLSLPAGRDDMPLWMTRALTLLHDSRRREQQLLQTSLAELFATPNPHLPEIAHV